MPHFLLLLFSSSSSFYLLLFFKPSTFLPILFQAFLNFTTSQHHIYIHYKQSTHPVRVVLFWDSDIARDVYGPYFTGLIQQQTVSITNDTNTINMTEHIKAITQMVSNEPSMFYPIVAGDEDENDHSDKEYAVSSESESDDNNDAEKEELQTPVNLVTKNTVTQWDSSQWFSSARDTCLKRHRRSASIISNGLYVQEGMCVEESWVLPLKALVELTFNKLIRYFNQHREEAQNCVHPFSTRVFDKFLRIELNQETTKLQLTIREKEYTWSDLRSAFMVLAITSIYYE
ncbi:hypothetical protein M9H77_22577 [Catharanthus roseus]|uniref:Uncharacterized protein n=1 Tax=Catharanthus roseus TaxID=4058 RepID=A0ACC0ASZ6_CATRO|nr:hypothetical protein M9H77_22577 [Catharanthus roseus]